jgi:preprotein translocase subunit SecG
MLVLALYPWVTSILAALFLFFCVLLILAVLIQRPTGGGLSGAFGSGAGSGQTAFGAKTGDALTYATITIFTVYLLFAVGLNFASKPESGGGKAGAATTNPASTGSSGSSGANGSTGAPSPTGASSPSTPAPTSPTAPAEPAAPAPATPPAPTGAPSGGQPVAPTGSQPG